MPLTPEQLDEVRRMRNDGVGIHEMAELLDVAVVEVRAAISAGLPPLTRRPESNERTHYEGGPIVTPRQLAERAARRAAPARDLTAALMGDPPVGFSALEREGAQ